MYRTERGSAGCKSLLQESSQTRSIIAEMLLGSGATALGSVTPPLNQTGPLPNKGKFNSETRSGTFIYPPAVCSLPGGLRRFAIK